jgi:acyl-CoA reductase-like NAD-dependent aldehyde dehydrogenase
MERCLYLAWRTFLLPMAFGNTTVIKPSELAPLSAGLIHAEILEEAGFPAGSFNIVTHAPGAAADVADVFFEHPAVRCINFTGSDKTARILGARAGQALKRMVMELGGFNPMLVLDDADVEGAVNATCFGAFLHQGQVCMNTRKVYVHRSIHDGFVEKLAAKVRGLKAGNPIDPSVIIGPLINDRAVEQTHERLKDALQRGARLVTGGKSEGRIFEPTILTDVPQDAICTTGCDETFGPLLVIEAFDDAEAALARAQNTPYGLSAAIMTRDQARGSTWPHASTPASSISTPPPWPARRLCRWAGEGQRLGPFGPLCGGGFHRSAPDHHGQRTGPLPLLIGLSAPSGMP